jgi:uncharacterized protein YegP (UPF0339 family)
MFEIKKAKGGYIVYLIAKNGEILMTSEILKTKKNADNNLLASVLTAFKYGVDIVKEENEKRLLMLKKSEVVHSAKPVVKKANKKDAKKVAKKENKSDNIKTEVAKKKL